MPEGVKELMRKRRSEADEVRTAEKTRVEITRLGGTSLARLTLEPGWHWAEHVQPLVGTKSCEMAHLVYALSGRLHVRMDTGEELVIEPEDFVSVAPGHDAWVEGDEPFVFLDLIAGEAYLKGAKSEERKAA